MQRYISKTITLLFVMIMFGFSATVLTKAQEDNSSVKDIAMASPTYYLMSLSIEPTAEETDTNTNEEEGILSNKSIRIINLGPVINHTGVDYAPTISADGRTLFYVSERPGSKTIPGSDDDFSHDFWAAKKANRLDTVFYTPYNIDTTTNLGDLGVNTPYNEGAASIAADRQTLYFTACNKPDGFGGCDIYKTTIEGDRWGRPTNLGRNVNSKNFDSQPSISPDQSRIYFISTREGPNSNGDEMEENFDIWYSDYDFDMEEWLPAKNLEQINTPGIEASPFIAADGVTLFFASTGYEPNYGDQDFYVTELNIETGKWSPPKNLGRPINTSGREQFITLPASGDIIYFSSTRDDLPGYQGSLDIFMAFVPTFFRTTIVKGSVFDECSDEFIPANITIKNPITGKVFTDSLSDNHKEFEIIVANQDYGNPRDSIKAVTLEITAENPKYGKTMKAQRVNKPTKTTNQKETNVPFEEIYVKLTLGQRPVLTAEMDEANYITRVKEKKPELASFRGLVMEQVQTWDLYPLLNYVFFDKGSSKIRDRYVTFDSPNQTEYFVDTKIAGGTLDKYYHILNIVGYRMKQFPDTKIELVGCNDGKSPEEKRPGLSKERADNIFNYLTNIWGIDKSRIKLKYRNKPDHPSNLNDSLGIQENWRVEILCKDWEILKPAFDKDPKTFPQPEKMNYIMSNGIEDALIEKRRVEIKHGDKMWKVLTDVGTTDTKYTWDWLSEAGKYPTDEVPFTAQLIVTTHSGAECKSDPIEIPVMQVSNEKKKVDKDADSTLEKYSLILFPFDRATEGPRNARIMRDYVYDRILPASVVQVIGHTDVVGLYDHNAKLSVRRSNTVYNGIQKKTKGNYSRLDKRGVGEDEPLYNNSTPEGRFYNRTVQVIIRTPVEAWEEIEFKSE